MGDENYVQPPRMPNLLSFNIGGWQNPQFASLGGFGQQLVPPRQQLMLPGGLTTPGGIQNGQMNQPGYQPTLGGFSAQLPAPPAGPSSGDAGSILSRTQRAVVKPKAAPLTPQPQGALSPAEYAAAMKGGGTPGVPAAAAAGAVPPNASGYNGMLDAQNFANNLGLANTIIGGVQSVGSIGLGIWQMMQAQEMNGIAKTAYRENYDSTAQAYNTRMEDQYRAARGNSPETDAAIEARKIKPSSIK